jgi:hypothetical protein
MPPVKPSVPRRPEGSDVTSQLRDLAAFLAFFLTGKHR